jgi:hypothetical protein
MLVPVSLLGSCDVCRTWDALHAAEQAVISSTMDAPTTGLLPSWIPILRIKVVGSVMSVGTRSKTEYKLWKPSLQLITALFQVGHSPCKRLSFGPDFVRQAGKTSSCWDVTQVRFLAGHFIPPTSTVSYAQHACPTAQQVCLQREDTEGASSHLQALVKCHDYSPHLLEVCLDLIVWLAPCQILSPLAAFCGIPQPSMIPLGMQANLYVLLHSCTAS